MKPTESKTTRQLSVVEDAYKQIQQIVHSQMKCAALKMAHSLLQEEVDALCGPPFSRKQDSLYHRGGSDPGRVLINGQRVKVKKPRVRSPEGEVALESYEALNDYDLLCERAMDFMLRGVSTRNYDPLLDEISDSTGLKKSSVSKAFVQGSREILDEMNSSDLSIHDIFAILIDGVNLGDRTVVTVMAISASGKKDIIGLREGNTEDKVLCRDLLASLVARGLNMDESLLFIIDGAKALRSAIEAVGGKRHAIQRCSNHKIRNLMSYVPKEYHIELKRRWKLVHGCVSFKDAKGEYDSLYRWLEGINTQAAKSLEESNEETLTLTKLGCPALLKKSLLTTNILESVFDKVRCQTNRVKNWSKSTDQASRWAAATLNEAQKKFKAIRGGKQIPVLRSNMKSLRIEQQAKMA